MLGGGHYYFRNTSRGQAILQRRRRFRAGVLPLPVGATEVAPEVIHFAGSGKHDPLYQAW